MPRALGAWPAVLLVVVVLAVYADGLASAFVWDDLHLVVGNPAIKRWESIPRLFVSDLFPGGAASGYYRPLQALTYALDYRLWGLSPVGFRLTNVGLHAATSVLLYRFGAALVGSGAALIGALCFAVHPLHVEAVTYVAGRSDPLAAVLMLAAVLGFRSSRRWARAGSVVAFFLAMLAREAAVILPLLLLVQDRAAPERPRRPAVAYLPYLVTVAAYGALRVLAIGTPSVTPATAVVPLGLRLLTTCEVVIRYLGLVFVPVALHMERQVTPVASYGDPVALGALALVVGLVVGAVALRRRCWPIGFGVLWFVVALLPVANLVPLATFMAEHWLYVPSMGIFLAIGWGVATLGVRAGVGGGVSWRPAVVALVALAVVGYGGLTARRNLDWRDGLTLYRYLLPLAPESLRVPINLAQAYQEAGRLDEAERLYEDVIRLHPDRVEVADALNNLGNLRRDTGQLSEALAALDRALVLDPRHVEALNGRALTLQRLDRADEAERALLAALAIAPDSATTRSNLGNLYFRRDDLERARDAYLAAIALDPDHADAHNNLGSTYFRLGRSDLAEREYRTALHLNPSSAAVQRNLAVLRAPAP